MTFQGFGKGRPEQIRAKKHVCCRERLAAENRMRQQMGVKLGGAVSDFQNRAQDLKKWEMLSKLDLYNVAGRNDIDPTS